MTSDTMCFTIAGIPIQVHSTLDLDTLGLRGRFGPFASTGEGDLPPVSLRWRDGDPDSVPRGELVHDPGSIWRAFRRPDGLDGHVIRIAYPRSDGGITGHAVLTVNRTWDEIEAVERRREDRWQSLLNIGLGELILRARVLFADGLVCHSSGVDDNGRGLLFVGHAGAGNSTQALLWAQEPGVTVMNDDRVAVRLHPNGPVIYGTPWGGTAEIARNHQAPLAAIIMIEQAPENAVELLPPTQAATLLAPRTFLPYWDADLLARALGHMDRLLQTVPTYRLRCRPERAVIPLVRGAL
jgi:hypothetical protein